MHALSPPPQPYWLPPMRFRLKPFLELSSSFSAALKELEERYPQRRPAQFTLDDRQQALLRRRPR